MSQLQVWMKSIGFVAVARVTRVAKANKDGLGNIGEVLSFTGTTSKLLIPALVELFNSAASPSWCVALDPPTLGTFVFKGHLVEIARQVSSKPIKISCKVKLTGPVVYTA